MEHIHQLTPHGLLLAGLGGCIAILLHTYAQHHRLILREVELHIRDNLKMETLFVSKTMERLTYDGLRQLLQRLTGHKDITILQRYLAQTTEDIRVAHGKGSPVENFS